MQQRLQEIRIHLFHWKEGENAHNSTSQKEHWWTSQNSYYKDDFYSPYAHHHLLDQCLLQDLQDHHWGLQDWVADQEHQHYHLAVDHHRSSQAADNSLPTVPVNHLHWKLYRLDLAVLVLLWKIQIIQQRQAIVGSCLATKNFIGSYMQTVGHHMVVIIW